MVPSDRLEIEVDHRESRGDVIFALKAQQGVEIRMTRLAAGDYLIDETLLVERKTLVDFACSIADGRLFSQAQRLAQSPHAVLLILEGTGRDLAATAMRREPMQGALVSLALSFGIPVLRARDAAETARLMLFAAGQIHRRGTGAIARSGHRPRGKRRRQSQILQGLPGIGPARAERLIDHFGSVEAVLTADLTRLAEVDGIGSALAESIRWAVTERPASYVACARDADVGYPRAGHSMA